MTIVKKKETKHSEKETNKESSDNNEKKKHSHSTKKKGTNKESNDNSKKTEAKPATQAVICENLIEFSPIVAKTDRASFSSNNPFLSSTTIENTKNPFEIDFKNPFGKINGQEGFLNTMKAI